MENSGNIKYDAGTRGDKNWVLQESVFDRSKLSKIESAFCQGNGYLRQRSRTLRISRTSASGWIMRNSAWCRASASFTADR